MQPIFRICDLEMVSYSWRLSGWWEGAPIAASFILCSEHTDSPIQIEGQNFGRYNSVAWNIKIGVYLELIMVGGLFLKAVSQHALLFMVLILSL